MGQVKVTLGFKAEEEYFAVNEQGNRVEIDMLSENKQAMSPMQLLLAGVVSCAAVDIVKMVRKRRKTLVDFKGEVVGTRRDEIPKRYVDMSIHYTFVSPDLTEDEAARIVELGVTKYCSVSASLDPAMPIKHSFEIQRP